MVFKISGIWSIKRYLPNGTSNFGTTISGFFRMYETWSWITQIVELQKSFPMTLNSKQFPGNWTSKITFLTFAWAFEWVGIFGQIFYVDQKMRNKIPHLSMSSQKGFEWKAVKKLKFSAEIIKTIRIDELMWPRWRSWPPR